MLARPSPPPQRVEAWHTSSPYHEDRLAKPSYHRARALPCTQLISARPPATVSETSSTGGAASTMLLKNRCAGRDGSGGSCCATLQMPGLLCRCVGITLYHRISTRSFHGSSCEQSMPSADPRTARPMQVWLRDPHNTNRETRR